MIHYLSAVKNICFALVPSSRGTGERDGTSKFYRSFALPQNDESRQLARSLIRDKGLRTTPARVAVLTSLLAATKPQTHLFVAEALTPLGIDKATVFRNLKSLTEVGLLRRTELGDHVWRFEAVRSSHESNDTTHPNFLCVDCGAITCLDNVHLADESNRLAQLVGEITEILVRGHCNQCR